MRVFFPLTFEVYYNNLKNLIVHFRQAGHTVDLARYEAGEVPFGSFHLGPCWFAAKPDVVVTNQSWWRAEHEVTLAAQRLGIPVITIEHGSPIVHRPQFGRYRREIVADHMLVWGEHGKDLMIKYGCPEAVLAVTGLPQHDDLLKPREVLPKSSRHVVLFLSSHTVEIPAIRSAYAGIEAECRKHGIELWLRPHPIEHLRNEYTIRDVGCGRIRAEADYMDLVSSCDLVVTPISSVLVGVYYFRKPFICCSRLSEPGIRDVFQTFGIESPSGSVLDRINTPVDEALYRRNLRLLAHDVDGKASRRCYDAILKICRERGVDSSVT